MKCQEVNSRMTEMDKIKTEIKEINDPVEMAGYLDGIHTAAAFYCKKNYPDEVIIENGKIEELTIYGMIEYLQKKVNEN